MSLLNSLIKSLSQRTGTSNQAAGHGVSNSILPIQRTGGQIICFTGPSQGDALAKASSEMMRPFFNLCSKVTFIDVRDSNWTNTLNEVLSQPVWFAISFFGIGQHVTIQLEGNPKNLWEASGVPFVRVYGDSPAYFPDRHVREFNNSINVYGDISHANFYRRWFNNPALSVVAPPILIGHRNFEENKVSASKNSGIIFPKNGNSTYALVDYWRRSVPKELCKALESIAETITSKEFIDQPTQIDTHILAAFDLVGIDVSAEPAVVCFLVAQLDDYLRRWKSTLMVESILDLPVTLLGKNWEHINLNGARLTHVAQDDFAYTQALLKDSLAVLDMAANYHNAPHDRVLRAAGQGTAFLTNKQAYFDHLLPRADQCTFSFNKHNIHDLVEHAILNPNQTMEVGLENARIMQEHHSLDKYVHVIISAVQIIALRLGGRPLGTQNFVDFPPRKPL